MNRSNRLLILLLVFIGINSAVFAPATTVIAQGVVTEIGEALTVGLNGSQETLGGEQKDYSGCTRIDGSAINADFEQRVVELLNIERAKVGAAPLKRSSDLDFAARYQTRDMEEDIYFDHYTQDRIDSTTTIIVCSPTERIKLYYSGYSAFGENLAAGYDTPEQVIAGWMASDGHRTNMLDPKYREVGIGYYEGGTWFREFWGMDLGYKSTVYPVVINSESAQTSSPNVTLYLYGKDVWGEVRLRNDADAWSAWMPFQERMNWQIPAVNGAHLLSVEMRKTGATTAGAASNDTITLSGYIDPDLKYRVFLPTIKR